MKNILLVAILLAVATSAHAQTTSVIRNWDEAGFSVSGLAQGRIGNAAQNPASNFTYEANIENAQFQPTAQADFNWQNNVATDWTLTYNAGSGLLNYNVGGTNGVNLQSAMDTANRDFSDIYIRVFRGDFAGSSTGISDLVYNGVALSPGGVTQNTYSGIGDAIRIADISPAQGFTLSGKSTFKWDAAAPATARPKNSQLAYQVKLGRQAPGNQIPEAGSLCLLLPTLAPVALLVRRRFSRG
ncbi:MAG: hypothetical protein H7Y38_16895 [Armatimonadetes bacterium]|nr:hypothetical protein [Armatimonadota bacterium]